ncbi:hypothetical protein ACOI9Y_33370, partial [Mesorhizobium japonicum]
IEAMRELCRVPPQPPRLYLRERKGQEARYVILDRGREIGTGFGESDQRGADHQGQWAPQPERHEGSALSDWSAMTWAGERFMDGTLSRRGSSSKNLGKRWWTRQGLNL